MKSDDERRIEQLLAENARLRALVDDVERLEREQTETLGALKASEERYRTLAEHLNVGLYRNTPGPEGRFIEVNPAFLKIFRFSSRQEALGTSVAGLYRDPGDRQRFVEKLLREGSVKEAELALRRRDGEEIVAAVSAVVVRDAAGEVLFFDGIIDDITERKRAEEALRQSERLHRELSIRDPLTGLFNVRQFYSTLEQEVERTRRYHYPLSLILLDLDDFKEHNDRYDHLEGDRVLQALAESIRSCIRRTDSAYRYGGEEFTVILPSTTTGDAAAVAERLRAGFGRIEFHPEQGAGVRLTLSLGVAEYVRDESLAEFVRRADRAMYVAKREGKNRVEISVE